MDKQIKMRCPKCGSETFKGPPGARLQDKVTCTRCGSVMTVQKIADPTIKQVRDRAEKTLTDALKEAGFKVTKK